MLKKLALNAKIIVFFFTLLAMMYPLLTILQLSLKEYMLPCLNKELLGVDCPGCGLQRSVALLFEGNLWVAFKMYPATFTLIPLFLVLISSKVLNFKFDNRLIIGLSIATVALILINYTAKLIF
ncbi:MULTISPECIES: DUF2752 domain-containing protein [Flavobacteriaceae]|uniref:DUF2752 domain-containing protein n=1 Tax=Flavobacteriaceae TaxID=49546 RepID=UPI0028BDABAE|nr:DUF2752 domain-containing protein [Muricauda sp. SP22]